MNGASIYVQLVNMRDMAGSNLYDRLVLARQALQDKDWVKSQTGGGGNENRAISLMEDTCFGENGFSLPQMLEILRIVPNKDTWSKNRYNLRRMWREKCERKEKPKKRVEFEASTEPLDKRDRLIATLQAQLLEAREDLKAYKEENARLKKDLRKLQSAFASIQILDSAAG